jgi:hypothetical protein
MSGLGCRPRSRVTGRPALTRRLRALLLAVHRFGQHRARSRDDVVWAGRLIDALFAALTTADPRRDPERPA